MTTFYNHAQNMRYPNINNVPIKEEKIVAKSEHDKDKSFGLVVRQELIKLEDQKLNNLMEIYEEIMIFLS